MQYAGLFDQKASWRNCTLNIYDAGPPDTYADRHPGGTARHEAPALALSPDGRLLATSGKTQELVLIDPLSGHIRQNVTMPSAEAQMSPEVSSHNIKPDKSGQISYTGLTFSPDGTRLYLSNVDGDIKVFSLNPDGQVQGLFSIALPAANAPRREQEIPAGLAVSRDGRRLYVALNLSNRLAEIDTATGKVLHLWGVGVAPYDVVLKGDKVYVSNWGGRLPDENSLTGPAGQGILVRVDPVRIHCQRRVGFRHSPVPRYF